MHDGPVVLFDGVCVLCNGFVQFLVKRDKKKLFKFTPLQSAAGEELLSKLKLPGENLQSVVLVEGERTTTKSTASLRILKNLSGLWFLAYALIIIPPVVRNLVYDFVARNRYGWFGKNDVCMLPSEDVEERFL